MARSTTRKGSANSAAAAVAASSPFALRNAVDRASTRNLVHVIKPGIRCDTEQRGHERPSGMSIEEIVVDASQGFIPLWERGTMLRWRFRESSFARFQDPSAAKSAVQRLFGNAVLAWGDAAPIKFSKQKDAWDFEIVMKASDDCDANGCVLASAFFPDSGQHQLLIYPKMFEQSESEQVETLVHEIGHIFGLRHFFAQISETKWASEIFGEHQKFTIMNYGPDSHLNASDKADLRRLYELAWSGKLEEINGTRIKFVRPFHTIGQPQNAALAARRARVGSSIDDPFPGRDPWRFPEARGNADDPFPGPDPHRFPEPRRYANSDAPDPDQPDGAV